MICEPTCGYPNLPSAGTRLINQTLEHKPIEWPLVQADHRNSAPQCSTPAWGHNCLMRSDPWRSDQVIILRSSMTSAQQASDQPVRTRLQVSWRGKTDLQLSAVSRTDQAAHLFSAAERQSNFSLVQHTC